MSPAMRHTLGGASVAYGRPAPVRWLQAWLRPSTQCTRMVVADLTRPPRHDLAQVRPVDLIRLPPCPRHGSSLRRLLRLRPASASRFPAEQPQTVGAAGSRACSGHRASFRPISGTGGQRRRGPPQQLPDCGTQRQGPWICAPGVVGRRRVSLVGCEQAVPPAVFIAGGTWSR
jgi:hypothetical protein